MTHTRNKKKLRRWLKRRLNAAARAADASFRQTLRAWAFNQDNEATTTVFARYRERIESRWSGYAALDARFNWGRFETIKPDLIDALRSFRGNPGQRTLNGLYGNPDCTLTGFLWKFQGVIQPDKSRLDPLLDFEERYQTCFLRRGLLIYCEFLLRAIATTPSSDRRQLALPV